MLMTEGRRATLRDLRDCWTPATRASLLAYWARTNVPGAAAIAEGWLRRRWPASVAGSSAV
jgi:hypothetical protein